MKNIGEIIGTIAEKMVPNLLSFVIQFSSFLILLAIVFFFAYKPVKKILAKRADYIQKEMDDAKENQLLAVKNAEEAKTILASSKVQASDIIRSAEQQGSLRANEIIDEAKEEAHSLLKQAQVDIVTAKQEALEDIRNEMVSVALAASKEILKREVDEIDNKRLAEDFVSRLN
ncbi:MAG TPA: F0F1 ATP synthase subunit B [Erysipelotrichaceae bacterium]|nr:F0F1 ATP synthase subunit B [Erysipelotrichaceae bacterium]